MKGLNWEQREVKLGVRKTVSVLEASNIVAIAECADGNAEVGSMWQEVHVFPPQATLKEVVEWAGNMGCTGKLIIRPEAPDLATP